jgi:glycosyltransferase involved in cell wall biosynthesis
MQQPYVSLVIPVYNTEKYIEECLESAIAQTQKNIEIICVDDGSTDRSTEILKEYSCKDERIRYIRQENAGLSSARNNGLNNAKGEYVLYFDSDDILDSDCINVLYKTASDNDLDLLFFGGKVLLWEDRELEKKKSFEMDQYLKVKLETNDVITGKQLFVSQIIGVDYRAAACFHFINREYALRANAYFKVGILAEDEEYMPRVMWEAKRAMAINDTLYFYRIRKNSITTGEQNPLRLYGLCAALSCAGVYSQNPQLSSDMVKALKIHIGNLLRGIVIESEKLYPHELTNAPNTISAKKKGLLGKLKSVMPVSSRSFHSRTDHIERLLTEILDR